MSFRGIKIIHHPVAVPAAGATARARAVPTAGATARARAVPAAGATARARAVPAAGATARARAAPAAGATARARADAIWLANGFSGTRAASVSPRRYGAASTALADLGL